MSNTRTLSWKSNGTEKQLVIESDEVFLMVILMIIMSVVLAGISVAGFVLGNPFQGFLGLVGIALFAANFLLSGKVIKD